MSAYWNSMDLDSEGTMSTNMSSASPARRYVDPWDLENYAYMKQRYDVQTPSAAGEPLDASFYYTPGDKHYDMYKTFDAPVPTDTEEEDLPARLDYRLHDDRFDASPPNYYHQPYSDGDLYGVTPDYSDMDDMLDGDTSPPVTDGSLLYMYETATRCRKMAVPRTSRAASAIPVYQLYRPAEEVEMHYGTRENIVPVYDDIGMKKTKPGNFGLSNYGHLKIDYSFSWNSLDMLIGK